MNVEETGMMVFEAWQARMLSVGTAHPPKKYSQQDLLDLYQVTNKRIIALFRNTHIKSRYLYLPPCNSEGQVPDETNVELLAKHKQGALDLGVEAIDRALAPLGIRPSAIDYLVCVTSTGTLCPGLSALYIKHLGFRENTRRLDVVGMGCNAGLNALQNVADFCFAHPGRLALLVCAEICSGAYVFDMTMRTAVVNSLFGDGVAALVVGAGPELAQYEGPAILDFESHIIPDAIAAMRFDLEGPKFSFFLDRDIPYVLGNHVEKPVNRLLARAGLKRRDIQKWIIHSGGRKVIDTMKYNLGITNYDVRHTLRVLQDFGNLSSGSFLFSYQLLLEEGSTRSGEYGVMITMGPGSTIETCLIRF